MEIWKIPIEKIKAARYNPRKNLKPGDPEYEKLRRSIEEFGYVEPIVFNCRTGHVVGGHQRYKILEAMGYTEFNCVVLDIDEVREKALNVALNKISGEWGQHQPGRGGQTHGWSQGPVRIHGSPMECGLWLRRQASELEAPADIER